MPINWQPSMSTGVQKIDDEHKELFRQINLLSEAMREGKGRDRVDEILRFLDDYTHRHFAGEEQLMDEVRCPVAAQNRRAHAEFIAKFNALRQRASQPGAASAVVLEIADFFGKWLSGHIAKIDAQLNHCTAKV